MVVYRQYRLKKFEEERQTMFTLISKILGKQMLCFQYFYAFTNVNIGINALCLKLYSF